LTFPFVVIFVLALIGLGLDERTHYFRLLLIAIIALGVGAAVSVAGFLNLNLLTTLTLPLLIIGFLTLIYKVAKTIRRKSLRLLGQNVFYLSIIVLLLGVFISAGAKNTTTVTNVKTNTPIQVMQLEIELSNIVISNSSATVYSEQLATIVPEYSTLKADVAIQQSGKTYQGSLSASFYPNYGLVLRPLIITTETGDIYAHLEYTDSLYNVIVQALSGDSVAPEDVSITVQTNPMVYLVWAGVAFMIVGICVQFAADLRQNTESVTVRK